jgi:hypothetical protein
MMEAVRTSETSVYYDETTRRSIPEDCNPHTRRITQCSLMMEAVRTSETSVYNNETTRRSIPEDCNLHTRRITQCSLMMEAVRTSETSVYYNETTRRSIPEDCNPHTRRCENLISHMLKYIFHSDGDVVWYWCLAKRYPVLWDFKVSRRRVWCSELSSGMYCRVKWLLTDVSEVRTASIIHPDDTQFCLRRVQTWTHVALYLCIHWSTW